MKAYCMGGAMFIVLPLYFVYIFSLLYDFFSSLFFVSLFDIFFFFIKLLNLFVFCISYFFSVWFIFQNHYYASPKFAQLIDIFILLNTIWNITQCVFNQKQHTHTHTHIYIYIIYIYIYYRGYCVMDCFL